MTAELIMSYSSSVKNRNGYALQTASLTDLAKYSINKSKIDQPVCYVYSGIKGTYNPTNIFFIDIDKEIEEVFNDPSKLFNRVPCIKAIQKSFSGKLHIFLEYGNKIDDEDTYNETSLILHAFVNEAINMCYGIDLYKLGIEDNKEYLDTHNAKWTQGLFISSYEPVYNLNWYLTKIDEQTIKFLKDKYDFLSSKASYKTSAKCSNETSIEEYKGERVKVDRNFVLKGYKGHDARWILTVIFLWIFSDERIAKKECDARFYYENGKSIFQPTNRNRRGVYLSKNIMEAMNELFNLGYFKYSIQGESNSNLTLGPEEYLSNRADEILSFIRNHKRVCIQSPTGTGKTVFIKGPLANEYENSAIIVPTNPMLELYKDFNIVSSFNNNKVSKNGVDVLIPDQALKHWQEIKYKNIIVDESHLLFLAGTYRESMKRFLDLLENWDGKLIMISATPSAEIDILKSVKFVINKKIIPIHVDIIRTDNTTKCYEDIVKGDVECDRSIIYSDRNNKYMYDDLVSKFGRENVANFRSSTMGTDDFEELLTTEKLSKKYNVATSIIDQGNNIKNEGERISMIIEADALCTTLGDIIQKVGRLRKSMVHVKIIIKDGVEESNTEEKIENAKIVEEFRSSNNVDSKAAPCNEEYLNEHTNAAKLAVESYNKDKVGADNLQRSLIKDGRFIVTSHIKYYGKGKCVSEIKRKSSKNFRDALIKDFSVVYEPHEKYSYEYEWSNKIKSLMYDYGISEGDIQEYISNNLKENLISTTLNNLDYTLWACTTPLKELQRYERTIANEVKKYKDEKDLDIKNIFIGYLKRVRKALLIKEKYGDKYERKDIEEIYCGDPFEEIFDDQKESFEKESKKISKKKSNAKKKKLKDPKTGKIYKSCEEAAADLNVSLNSITRKINKKQLIRI